MTDRVALNPGRFKMTDLGNGFVKLELADDAVVQGTDLNKNTFLKDATAGQLGLPQADPTVDDALAWFAKYNEYWWSRKTVEYEIVMPSDLSGNVGTGTLYYSSEVEIVAGVISLKNPQSMALTASSAGAQAVAALAPCYYKIGNSSSAQIMYLPTGATGGTSTSNTIRYSSSKLVYGDSASVKAKTCMAVPSFGDEELVHSATRSAYPDSGESGGYEYRYIGQPFADLPIKPRIQTGSYIGTGTYGESNPNGIEFAFEPKLVLIYSADLNMVAPYIVGAGSFYVGSLSSGGTLYANTVTINGNTMSWYSTGAQGQLNRAPSSGIGAFNGVYNWTAIG